MMVQQDAKVTLHYSLSVEGEQIDSSDTSDPLVYVHGSGQMIPGFEKNLEGLESGDKKKFSVGPELGYGFRDEDIVRQIPRDNFENESLLKEGEILSGQIGQQPFQATIVEIQDDMVTLDFNHPLAGRTLDFEVEVIAVEPFKEG